MSAVIRLYPLTLLVGIVLCMSGLPRASAQVSVKDSVIKFTFVSITGQITAPGGDLADEFGTNYSIGFQGFRKWKSQWMLGLQADFLFGEQVKENGFLVDFATSRGYIINQQGTYGNVLLYERGWRAELRVGRCFPWLGPNDNSGWVFMAGAGFLQHKIRIESQGDDIPYLENEYVRGYDRLSNGPCVSAFTGYYNFGNRRRINFFAGVEFTTAFTRNRRGFNFDTRQADNTLRTDQLWGLRAGWIIPLYKKIPNTYYFN